MATRLTIKQGQSVSFLLTLDTPIDSPVYVGIYPLSVGNSRLLLSSTDGGLVLVSEGVYSASITPQQTASMSGEFSLEVLIGNPSGSPVAISLEPVTLQVVPSRIGKEVVG